MVLAGTALRSVGGGEGQRVGRLSACAARTDLLFAPRAGARHPSIQTGCGAERKHAALGGRCSVTLDFYVHWDAITDIAVCELREVAGTDLGA
ncbi:MAG: hypothetical protein QOK10_3682 [Pseudonocardiales bacterium]|nr:hypothetical protein [Pseudonocardiales bacterium]